MSNKEHEKFIRLAFEQARLAVEAGNEPFGAVLVKGGEVLAYEQNKINTESDPTWHSDTALIRNYCHEAKVTDLSDYTLYTPCEPCVMCAGCMVWSRLGRVVYSITIKQLLEIVSEGTGGALSQEDDRGIDMPCAEVFAHSRNPIEVIAGILEDEGLELYRGYLLGNE